MALIPLSAQTIQTDGVVVTDARLYVYAAGTTTPKSVYTSAALTTLLPNPVPVSGSGRFPPMFVGEGDYKLRITDSTGVVLDEIDGLPGDAATVTVDAGTDPYATNTTGALQAAYGRGRRPGWERCNGNSIGSSLSSASESADDDLRALFIFLWNADASLVVDAGRGASALADWQANKAIALPDFRGRFLAGLDKMGAPGSGSGLLTGAGFSDTDKLGATAGATSFTITADQMPSHSHVITVSGAGGHTPSGSISNVPDHTHDYIVSTAGDIGVTGGASIIEQIGSQTLTATGGGGGHGHTFSGTPVADHTHTATSALVGGSLPVSVLPPTALVTFYIKR